MFLAAPLRRQVIVKEKLVFPSGSESIVERPGSLELTHRSAATAQLIALLHEIPPPSQTLSGTSQAGAYRRIPRSGESNDARPSEDSTGAGAVPVKAEQSEVMGNAGWRALGWSFLASGFMTVCHTVSAKHSHECIPKLMYSF